MQTEFTVIPKERNYSNGTVHAEGILSLCENVPLAEKQRAAKTLAEANRSSNASNKNGFHI